ncbi:MAG: hypothetical protein ACIAQZ_09480 [Sedimentisphaeraceae bacterium JB056]
MFYNKVVSSLVLITVVLTSFALAEVFYVDPSNGNDSFSGKSVDECFRTIERAKLAVSKVNSGMFEDIVVYLKEGVYEIDSPVIFSVCDSGFNSHKVIYRNFPGEKPILFGGKKLDVQWQVAEGKLLKGYIGKGLSFRQIYVNSEKKVRAREPEIGEYYKLKSEIIHDGFNIEKGLTDNIVSFDDIELSIKTLWMHKRLRVDKVYSVGEFDRLVINPLEWDSLKNEPQGARKYYGKDFWLENALEFIDTPGEWYYNRSNGLLYYYPLKDQKPENIEVVIPQTQTLISLGGSLDEKVRDIVFDGLSFTYTNWTRPDIAGFVDVQANTLLPLPENKKHDSRYRHNQQKDRIPAAMEIHSGDRIKVENCHFNNLGGTALTFNYGGNDNIIASNKFSDIAATAVEVGNDCYKPLNQNMWPRRYLIYNNEIDNIGTDYFGSLGIMVFYCDSIIIEHNDICNVPYSGINVGWGWLGDDIITEPKNAIVRNNRVEKYLAELVDGAAIYSPNPVYASYAVGNYVKDMMTQRHDPAFYNDGCGAYWIFRNNVIENAQRLIGQRAFNPQIKRDIIAENNFTTTLETSVTGHNRVVRDNYVYKDVDWPEKALDIIKNAGLTDKPCPALPLSESDEVIIVDNSDDGFSSCENWNISADLENFYGKDYALCRSSNKSQQKWACWKPKIKNSGSYHVYIRYPVSEANSEYVPVEVGYNGGKDIFDYFTYDQKSNCYDRQWIFLGRFELLKGQGNYVKLYAGEQGDTVADAVKFVALRSDSSQDNLDIGSMMQPVPEYSILEQDKWHIWGATILRADDGKYHLFYSRWRKELGFQSWATHSKIAHAVAETPGGTYRFKDVALGKREGNYWDSHSAHNPTVKAFDGRYYLYYTGSTGDGMVVHDFNDLNWTHRNNQRIGVAVADSLDGPWRRLDEPIIDVSADAKAPDSLCVCNPSVTQGADGKYLMVYKAVACQRPLPFGGPVTHLTAIAESPEGPFIKRSREVFIASENDFPAEDPFVWYDRNRCLYYAIVKDKASRFADTESALVLFCSKDGLRWSPAKNPFITIPEIRWENRLQKIFRLERPQLYFENGKPKMLFLSVLEKQGNNGRHSYNIHVPLAANY